MRGQSSARLFFALLSGWSFYCGDLHIASVAPASAVELKRRHARTAEELELDQGLRDRWEKHKQAEELLKDDRYEVGGKRLKWGWAEWPPEARLLMSREGSHPAAFLMTVMENRALCSLAALLQHDESAGEPRGTASKGRSVLAALQKMMGKTPTQGRTKTTRTSSELKEKLAECQDFYFHLRLLSAADSRKKEWVDTIASYVRENNLEPPAEDPKSHKKRLREVARRSMVKPSSVKRLLAAARRDVDDVADHLSEEGTHGVDDERTRRGAGAKTCAEELKRNLKRTRDLLNKPSDSDTEEPVKAETPASCASRTSTTRFRLPRLTAAPGSSKRSSESTAATSDSEGEGPRVDSRTEAADKGEAESVERRVEVGMNKLARRANKLARSTESMMGDLNRLGSRCVFLDNRQACIMMDRERGAARSSGAVAEEPDERVVREPDLVNPHNYTHGGAFLRDSSILGIPVASYELNSAAFYAWSERDYVRAAMRAVATGFKAEPDLPDADASDTSRKKGTPTDASGPGVLVMVTPKVEQDPSFYGVLAVVRKVVTGVFRGGGRGRGGEDRYAQPQVLRGLKSSVAIYDKDDASTPPTPSTMTTTLATKRLQASFLTAFVTKRLLSGLAGREHLAKAVREFQAVLEPFAAKIYLPSRGGTGVSRDTGDEDEGDEQAAAFTQTAPRPALELSEEKQLLGDVVGFLRSVPKEVKKTLVTKGHTDIEVWTRMRGDMVDNLDAEEVRGTLERERLSSFHRASKEALLEAVYEASHTGGLGNKGPSAVEADDHVQRDFDRVRLRLKNARQWLLGYPLTIASMNWAAVLYPPPTRRLRKKSQVVPDSYKELRLQFSQLLKSGLTALCTRLHGDYQDLAWKARQELRFISGPTSSTRTPSPAATALTSNSNASETIKELQRYAEEMRAIRDDLCQNRAGEFLATEMETSPAPVTSIHAAQRLLPSLVQLLYTNAQILTLRPPVTVSAIIFDNVGFEDPAATSSREKELAAAFSALEEAKARIALQKNGGGVDAEGATTPGAGDGEDGGKQEEMNSKKKNRKQKGLGQTMVDLTEMGQELNTWKRQALFDAYARENGLTRAIVPVGREWLFKDNCALQGLFFKGVIDLLRSKRHEVGDSEDAQGAAVPYPVSMFSSDTHLWTVAHLPQDENKGGAVDENKGGADAALCSTDETSNQQEDGCKQDRTVVDLAQWHFGGASLDLEVHEEGVAADDGGSRRRVAFNVIGEVADGVKEDYEMECVRELRQAARRIPRTSEEKGDVGEESESDDGRSSDEFELEPRQSCPNPLRWLASDVLLAGGETVKEQETIANGKETRASGRSPALSPEAVSELLQNDKTGLFKTLIEM